MKNIIKLSAIALIIAFNFSVNANTNGLVNIQIIGAINSGGGSATNALIVGPSGSIYDAGYVTNVNAAANGLVTNTPAGIAAAGGITNNGTATLGIIIVTNPGSSFSSVITPTNIVISGDYWGAEADVGSVYWEPNGHWYSAWIGGTGDALQFANGISGSQFQFTTNGGGMFIAPQFSGGGSNLTAGTTLAQIPSPSSVVSSNQAALIAGATVGGSGMTSVTNGGIVWSFTAPGQLSETNTGNGSSFLIGTNGHMKAIDQFGDRKEWTTNYFITQIMVAGVQRTLLFSNDVLSVDGQTISTNGGAFSGTFNGNSATATTAQTATNAGDFVTPESFGAYGDGDFTGSGHDDTVALQNAINFSETNPATLQLKLRRYLVSSTLIITSKANIKGAGVNWLMGSSSNASSAYIPTVAPYITGSIIQQTTAGADIIQATNLTQGGAGYTLNLSDFGLTWTSNLCFIKAGNGIVFQPAPYGGMIDNGLWASQWKNITVFGHGTNSYGFVVYNGTCNDYDQLRTIGGGGFHFCVSNAVTPYGNSTFKECYFQDMFAGNTSALLLERIGNGPNVPALISLIQNNLQTTSGNFYITQFGLTGQLFPPINGQWCMYVGDGFIYLTGVGNDFESGFPLTTRIRLPHIQMPGLDLGMSDAVGVITNVANTYTPLGQVNPAVPHLLGGPISWGPYGGGSDDLTFAGMGEMLRLLDNPDSSGNWVNFGLGLSSKFVTMHETAVGASYGWQWVVTPYNTPTGNYAVVAKLTQDGTFTVSNLVVSGNASGNGNGLTGIPASGISTNGGQNGMVMINGGQGTVIWTNDQTIIQAGSYEFVTSTTNPITGVITYTVSGVSTNQFLASTGGQPFNGGSTTNLNPANITAGNLGTNVNLISTSIVGGFPSPFPTNHVAPFLFQLGTNWGTTNLFIQCVYTN